MIKQSIDSLWEQAGTAVSPEQTKASWQQMSQRISLYESSVRRNKRTRLFQFIGKAAAILLLPLLSAWGTYYYIHSAAIVPEEIPWEQHAALLGATSEFYLSDSTHVYLNSGSSLFAPREFTGTCRKVYLVGEGYFKVAKNPDKPFIVETRHLKVQALGTQFAICSYQTSDQEEATLTEGSVSVTLQQDASASVVLKPNQQCTYSQQEGMQVRSVNAQAETAWKEQKLIFDQKQFADVMKRLSFQYGYTILVAPELQNKRVTAKFLHHETLDEVLKTLQQVFNYTYTRDVQQKRIYVKPINNNAYEQKRK